MYGPFLLSASAVVVLLALSTYVLGRLIGHDRALGAMLAPVAVFTGVGAGFGLPPGAAALPLLLGFAFLYVPVGVDGLLAKAVSVRPWREVCRLLMGGGWRRWWWRWSHRRPARRCRRSSAGRPASSASTGTSASSRT